MEGIAYPKLRRLGEGAVGEVSLCVDMFERRLVVIKLLRADVHEQSDAARRFRREAKLLAEAPVFGVVHVREYGIDTPGRAWMAMEFVDGLSPATVIHRGDGSSVYRLLSGLAHALDELHGRGIVHRDLKPDNIILRALDGHWEPVIIDLGIAKWLAQVATASGAVFGTPHYMSPEQFRDSKRVGPATDRYALAVIAYELLCGRLPFDGRSLPALLQQHTEATVPPLRLSESPSRGPTPTRSFLKNGKETRAAAAVDAFMQRALAKRPEDRFSSAREMADAFGEALRTDGLWQEGSTTRKQLFESLAKPYVELSMGGHTQRYDLREGPVVLGRHEYAQFVVPSSRVSRQHACVFLQRGRAWIADLASQNGTNAHGKHVAEGVPAPLTTDGELNMLRLYDMDLCARFVDGHA